MGLIPVAKPYLTEKEAQAAHDTILTGWITQGPKVSEFEIAFAKHIGSKFAIAVSNCTTALHLSMILHDIGPGDEVICPSLSYIATANCIRYVGATPVFAEVDPITYNLDLKDTERRITRKTKAILLVHQMGMPADTEAFRGLCSTFGLKLIEDAACAAGSSLNGKKIGADSELACFSFHPRKVITTGDGGMIATSREDFYHRIKLLRQHGMSVNDRVRHESKTIIIPDHLELGFNYRLTDVQAAIGLVQLNRLDWLVAERRKIAALYFENLFGVPHIRLPFEDVGVISNFQSFPVYLLPGCAVDRNNLMQKLLEKGIATRSGVMTAHRETAYKETCGGLKLPVSEDLCDRSVLLPLYVPMDQSDVERVASALKALIA